jgi:hypothetical protein
MTSNHMIDFSKGVISSGEETVMRSYRFTPTELEKMEACARYFRSTNTDLLRFLVNSCWEQVVKPSADEESRKKDDALNAVRAKAR